MNKAGTLGSFNMFTLWFGAAVSLAEIMTGSLLAPLGLRNGILIILLGHLIGTLIFAFVGIIGFREKSPSLRATRLSLGRCGSYIISIFNIIQLVGWTAIMLIQCARSLQSITGKLFGFDNFFILVILTGLLVGIWAFNTQRGISAVNSIAVLLLLFLSVIMLQTVLQGKEAQEVAAGISVGMALELCIIMPLSWLPLISDYTMLGKSSGGSFWGSFSGYFLGSSFMYIIGLTTAIYTGSPDPVGILTGLNLGFAALLIVVLSTVTTTFLDVYSAVMSTLNLSERFSRGRLILAFTSLGVVLAMFFPMEHYESFLYLIGSLFAPVFTVVLADYFLFKEDRSGDKFNIWGLAAAAAGVAAYYFFVSRDLVLGATVPAMAVTIIVYLTFRLIKNQMKIRTEQYAR